MTQKIIALVGISGAGKTTFLNKVAFEIQFQHLTAGSLISAAKDADSTERDELRLADISDNQKLLIKGFNAKKGPDVSLIVLDGHAVVDGENGLEAIDRDVFAQLGIDMMMHLVATSSKIFENKKKDKKRNRPSISIDTLEEHQNVSLRTSKEIAQSLSIPWHQVTFDDISVVRELMISLTNEHQ